MAVLDLGLKPSSEGRANAGSRRLSPAAARGLVYDAAVKAETGFEDAFCSAISVT